MFEENANKTPILHDLPYDKRSLSAGINPERVKRGVGQYSTQRLQQLEQNMAIAVEVDSKVQLNCHVIPVATAVPFSLFMGNDVIGNSFVGLSVEFSKLSFNE